MEEYLHRSVLDKWKDPEIELREIDLLIKRDDLIDPLVSGNKWRKLKYHVLRARELNKAGLLTFGGAFSNHLLATARVAQLNGLKARAFVRGEELSTDANPVLQKCAEMGMQLEFIPRDLYALRNDWDQLAAWKSQYADLLLVPEGGASYYGMIGCQEIIKELPDFDEIFLALGTGTTTAGLLMGLRPTQRVHAVPVLKGFDVPGELARLYAQAGFDSETVSDWLGQLVTHTDYHFGGYAKTTPELLEFMERVEHEHRLPLDPMYTAKAFYALYKYMLNDPAACGKKIVFLHTGGLIGGKSLVL